MGHKKRRVMQHQMEEESRALVRRILPGEWVVRDYRPDYGIDIAVEIFEPTEGSDAIAEAAGEWFLAQVKSVKKAAKRRLKVYARGNVEKALHVESTCKEEYVEVDVVSCEVDCSLLLTIQALGAGTPVLLFLVTLDTRSVYFICLNDAIDKCIVPEDDRFGERTAKTIHIPARNIISGDPRTLVPLKFLAKRPKLYSAFCKFAYQENEVQYLVEELVVGLLSGENCRSGAVRTVLHFCRVVERYDFWTRTDEWPVIRHLHGELLKVQRILTSVEKSGRLSTGEVVREFPRLFAGSACAAEPREVAMAELVSQRVGSTWGQLRNLNNVYEEVCREWFLPTYLSSMTAGE